MEDEAIYRVTKYGEEKRINDCIIVGLYRRERVYLLKKTCQLSTCAEGLRGVASDLE